MGVINNLEKAYSLALGLKNAAGLGVLELMTVNRGAVLGFDCSVKTFLEILLSGFQVST